MQRGTRLLAQPLSCVWAWLVLILSATLQTSISLAGDTPRFETAINPGPLQAALDQLAESTGLQILYDPPLVQGRSVVRPVKGKLSPREALEQILASTGISFKFTASDAVALYAEGSSSQRRRPPETADPIRPPTVIVSTDSPVAYEANVSVTAMKTAADSLDTPLVSIPLTQQVLRDQQAGRLEDVLEYVSGVEVAPNGESAVGFSIRGFPTYQYYVDGVRVTPDLNHDGFRDLANIERIELVKGPLSTLYGRSEPGGLINVITKQPLEDPYLSMQQQAGDFSRLRTAIDAGGPLSPDKDLLYRFNAAYETGESYRGFEPERRIFLAPVVSWRPSQRTENTFYLEYLNSHDPTDSGLPVIGGQLPPVSAEETVEEGGEVHTTDLRLGARGEHIFNNGWEEHYYIDARWLSTPQAPQLAIGVDGLLSVACAPNSCPVSRNLLAIPESRGDSYSGAVNLTGAFKFWHTQHSVLLGVDLVQSTARRNFELESEPGTAIDLFHPQHAPVPPDLPQAPLTYTATGDRWIGFFAQDQISTADRLDLLVGGRYDLAAAGPDLELHENRLTGRAGLVWHVMPGLSAYSNFTQGFGVSSGIYALGTTYPSIGGISKEWEIGLKAELLERRVGGSVVWFDLTKHDFGSPVQLLTLSGNPYEVSSARNRGLEVDVQGEVILGWQLLASAAYIESRVLDTNYNGGLPPGFLSGIQGSEVLGVIGNRLPGVPRVGGSFWVAYNTAEDSLRGLKLGLGAVARGAREGDSANDYPLPGFIRWNALAAYGSTFRGTRLTLQLNVDNLFNKRYFESVSGTYIVMPGAPRRWLASVRAVL